MRNFWKDFSKAFEFDGAKITFARLINGTGALVSCKPHQLPPVDLGRDAHRSKATYINRAEIQHHRRREAANHHVNTKRGREVS